MMDATDPIAPSMSSNNAIPIYPCFFDIENWLPYSYSDFEVVDVADLPEELRLQTRCLP